MTIEEKIEYAQQQRLELLQWHKERLDELRIIAVDFIRKHPQSHELRNVDSCDPGIVKSITEKMEAVFAEKMQAVSFVFMNRWAALDAIEIMPELSIVLQKEEVTR